MNISQLRENYSLAQLDETDLLKNPIEFFNFWLSQAIESKIPEPNAMTLCTVNQNSVPASRIVLLKEVTPKGLIFYTNYGSDKAKDIAHNPNVSLNFLWKELQRQVHIQGIASKVSMTKSEAYFQSRPKASQIGAWVSAQSSIIPSRSILEERKKELELEYANTEILPLPDFWGGYEVIPSRIEFWQGRPSRLHDRLVYSKLGMEWTTNRLSP